MLWTILLILLILWLVGFVADVAGGFIHLLLLAGVVVLVFRLLSGRSTV